MDNSNIPHLRHPSSLEGLIDSFPAEPLDIDIRAQASRRFLAIVGHFEAVGDNGNQYNRASLVRLTYEYVRSEESRDTFLRAFFGSMELPMEGEEDVDLSHLGPMLFSFADYLMDNFFLPMRASSKKTPQLSPSFNSAIREAQNGGVQEFAGTPGRLSALRRDCLIRDRNRCVITRRFDYNKAREIIQRGEVVTDDDGNPLPADQLDRLEVAHILPHALTKLESGSELSASKKAALDILNMFDTGVLHLIEGPDIDRSRNAITLAPRFHDHFGLFEVFFQPVPEAEPHTYRIDSFLPPSMQGLLPITRVLYQTEDRTIDPPSPRFLAIHYAIAHILHLSGAAEYIDQVLDDMEKVVQPDGSTDLGRFVGLRLDGWAGTFSA